MKSLQSIHDTYLNDFCSQISECMELRTEVTHLKEQLSQALEAKDLLSSSMIQKNRVSHEVEHHVDQDVAREISSEPQQKQQQVCFQCSSFHFLYNWTQGIRSTCYKNLQLAIVFVAGPYYDFININIQSIPVTIIIIYSTDLFAQNMQTSIDTAVRFSGYTLIKK